MKQYFLNWFLGDENTFREHLVSHPIKTSLKVFLALLITLIGAIILSWVLWFLGPKNIPIQPYSTIQTVYLQHQDNQPSYIDLNGEGMLVPDITRTIQAATTEGAEKMHMHRVVAMVFDPATYYSITPSGSSAKMEFNPKDLYVFYLLDEKKRTQIITVGKEKYEVKLLYTDGPTIDGRWNYSYTFSVIKK